jgi:anti-sigma factor RsiW
MSRQEMNHMECQEARRWIQGYLDGELQEAQAAPLRKHLLDCQPCRASAQSEKNLKRWFVEPKSVAVPRDFAARVARRAFAGDRGERFSDPVMAGVGGGAVLSMSEARGAGLSLAARGEERNLRFVLTLTAAAAAVLMMISLGIRSLNLPSGTNMRADDRPTMSIEEARQHLDQLNRSVVMPPVPTHAVQSNANAKQAAKNHRASTSPVSTPDAGAAQKPAEPKQ